jgi:HTH-type transcriptional regulator, competence development regulator
MKEGEHRMANPASPIGKELRKLRVENDERLLDMAAKVQKSAAFISAVETGSKTPPSGFEDLVIKAYGLVDDVAARLREAATASRRAFVVTPNNALGRDTVALLARQINSLSDDQLREIRSVLSKREE